MNVTTPDYYEILELPRSARVREIRMAHRALSRLYHPDTAEDGKGNPPLFAHIQEAYEILSGTESRREYDRQLAMERGESAGNPRRPPKTACAVCGTPVYASQLKLFLGRYMCKACLDRKSSASEKPARVTGLGEILWNLKRLRIWLQSHLLLIILIVIAIAVACFRVGWAARSAGHPAYRTGKNQVEHLTKDPTLILRGENPCRVAPDPPARISPTHD